MNFLAIISSVILSMIIGFVWYSRPLFGNAWMKLVGLTSKDIENSKEKMPLTYGGMIVTSLVQASVLSYFITTLSVEGAAGGIQIAFLTWLGFIATVGMTTVLFSKKPLKLYFIEVGYQLVYMLIAGAIIGAWR